MDAILIPPPTNTSTFWNSKCPRMWEVGIWVRRIYFRVEVLVFRNSLILLMRTIDGSISTPSFLDSR